MDNSEIMTTWRANLRGPSLHLLTLKPGSATEFLSPTDALKKLADVVAVRRDRGDVGAEDKARTIAIVEAAIGLERMVTDG